MPRLFLALPLPEPVRDQLLDVADEGLPLRWQSDDQLHLTVRFIGDVDRHAAQDLVASLGQLRFPPLTLRCAGLGRFDHRRSGVLWAGIEPREPLKALASRVERLCQAAGQPPERRAFHPHVTLARWSGRAPDLAPLLARYADISTDAWDANSLTLYESHLGKNGAHYETVATFG
jgi:2'-5' RNA ligase